MEGQHALKYFLKYAIKSGLPFLRIIFLPGRRRGIIGTNLIWYACIFQRQDRPTAGSGTLRHASLRGPIVYQQSPTCRHAL